MDYAKFSQTINRSKMFYWQVDRPFDAREVKEVFLNRHQKFNRKEAIAAIAYGMQQAGKKRNNAKVVYLSKPIASGSVNIVCKAVLADNTKAVIRMHPPKIKNGYFWVESVAAKSAKEIAVPAYDTYFIDDTQTKFDFDYMIIECLPGKNIHKELWPLSMAKDKILMEQTGFYAAKINSLKTEKFGFFDNKIAKNKQKLVGIQSKWSDHLDAAFEDNIEYLNKTRVFNMTVRKEIENIYGENLKQLKFTRPALVHNDIADWNQLAVGNKITGILDWDECLSGDPVAEFAAWSLFFSLGRMQYFKKGYLKITPLSDEFENRFHLYRIRYLVSKLALRKKKLMFKPDSFMQQLLDHGLKTLDEELNWYKCTQRLNLCR